MAAAIRVLDEAIRDAPDARWRTRAGVEREFARLEGEACRARSARCTWPTPPCACSSTSATPTGSAGRGGCARRRTGSPAASAAPRPPGTARRSSRSADERELFVILGWRATAAVLGPTPSTRRSRAARRSASASAQAPWRSRGWSTRWPRCTRCEATSPQAHACLDAANAVLRELAGWSGFVSHHEALVQLLAGTPRARRGSRCGRAEEARGDRRPRAAGHDRRDARAGAVRPGPLRRSRRAVRAGGGRGRGRRHRHAGHLARRAGQAAGPRRATARPPRRSRARPWP